MFFKLFEIFTNFHNFSKYIEYLPLPKSHKKLGFWKIEKNKFYPYFLWDLYLCESLIYWYKKYYLYI